MAGDAPHDHGDKKLIPLSYERQATAIEPMRFDRGLRANCGWLIALEVLVNLAAVDWNCGVCNSITVQIVKGDTRMSNGAVSGAWCRVSSEPTSHSQ